MENTLLSQSFINDIKNTMDSLELTEFTINADYIEIFTGQSSYCGNPIRNEYRNIHLTLKR